MFRLTTNTQADLWLDLSFGVRVQVRPLSTAIYQAANNEAARRIATLRAEAEDAAKAGQPLDETGMNGANQAYLTGLFNQYQTEALARYGIIQWEGIAGEDGQPAPLTPDYIKAFAAQAELAASFKSRYDATLAQVEAEAGKSETSSAGGTEEVGSTAEAAPQAEETEAPAAADAAPAS